MQLSYKKRKQTKKTALSHGKYPTLTDSALISVFFFFIVISQHLLYNSIIQNVILRGGKKATMHIDDAVAC